MLPNRFRGPRVWKQNIAVMKKAESAQWVAGAPEGIRTPDPQIRSLVLYPAELPALWWRKVEGPKILRPLHPQIRSHIRIKSATFLGHPAAPWQMKIKMSSRGLQIRFNVDRSF